MKSRWMKGLLALPVAACLAHAGCQPEGPAEKAGKGIDNVGRDIKDAVNPAGPAEKAGRDVDKALGK